MLYYRYRPGTSLSMKELIYDEMYFSSVSECNDPYEGNLFAVFEKTPEYWERLIKQALSKEFQEEHSSLVQSIINHCIEISPISVKDFLSLNCDDFNIKLGVDDTCSTEQATKTFILNKAIEVIKHSIEVHALEEHYFVSFSKSRDNLLMWSHYANNHKGYCLVFRPVENKIMQHRFWLKTGFAYDTPNSSLSPKMEFNFPEKGFPIHDIEYSDEPINKQKAFLLFPNVVYPEHPPKEIDAAYHSLVNAFLRKHTVWNCEEEVRLLISGGIQLMARQILRLSKHQRLFHYDPSQLVGIILGARMPEEQKSQIEEIIQQKLNVHGLSFGFVIFDARLSTNTVKIEVTPVRILYPTEKIDKKHASFNMKWQTWEERNRFFGNIVK